MESFLSNKICTDQSSNLLADYCHNAVAIDRSREVCTMRCIYVYPVWDPEDGYHVCDPEEMRDIVEADDAQFMVGWTWRWSEL